jgi:hypothetical protein
MDEAASQRADQALTRYVKGLTAGRLAEILRPVVRHQASGIQAFG